MKALQFIGLGLIKTIVFAYRAFLFLIIALVPIGFAFEVWDWIMGR